MTRWLSLALCLGAPVAAHADAISLLGQFNAIVFGSFASNSDVEGRAVIGGDMIGGATFALKPLPGTSSYSALTVHGNVTSSGYFNVDQGGGVTVLGRNSGNFNLNGGGSVSVGGDNTGNLNASGGGSASISVGGTNSGTLSLSGGGSVSVGGTNDRNGQITVTGGQGSVAVLGRNHARLTLNAGGSVYVGPGNSGDVSVNGDSGSVAIDGGNSAHVTMNNGGSVRIHGNTGSVSLNGGSLTYSGAKTGHINANNHATVTRDQTIVLGQPTVPSGTLPNFRDTFQAQLTQLSAQLASQAPNSSVRTAGNQVTLSAHPDAAGQAVLDVTSGLFAGNTTLCIALNGASTFIVNVAIPGCAGGSGCSLNLPSSLNFQNPTSYAANVLWNFTDATSLDFPNAFGGTVLSPYATVTNHNAIDGTLVAAAYTGQGELHSYALSSPTVVLATSSSNGSTPVPEPSSLVVLASGFALLVGWRGRGRWAAVRVRRH